MIGRPALPSKPHSITSLSRRKLLALAGLGGLAGIAGLGTAAYFARGRSMFATKTIGPAAVRASDGTLFYDFGKVWFGNLSISSGSAVQGTKVRVRLGETLGADGKIDRNPPGTVRYYETEVTLKGGEVRPDLTPADKRGLEDYGRPAMPFRFAEIEGPQVSTKDLDVRLHSVVAGDVSFDGLIKFTGHAAPATDLNRLFDFGLHTMEATSFMGVFVDGDRERLPYEADGFINQLGWYAVTSDVSVPRRTIASLLKKPTWPSEWMIHLIFMVWADFMMTGDVAYLRSVIDKLKIFSLTQFIDETGLVTTVNPGLSKEFVKQTGADYLEDIVDWPQVERDGYEMVRYNTVVNAFVYRGQVLLEVLNTALGRTADALENKKVADRLRNAMQSKLIDPKSGLYADGLGSQHFSAHASFFPLAFGLVPAAHLDATIALLRERIAANNGGFPCSVYGAQYLLDGLFNAGQTQMAMDLMLNRSVRGWFNMLDVHDATVTFESWDPMFKPNIDFTHAWGAAFLNVIQRHVAGVRATAPGWTTWTVGPIQTPQVAFTAHVPTVHGLIYLTITEDRKVSVRSPRKAKFETSDELRAGGWAIPSVEYY